MHASTSGFLGTRGDGGLIASRHAFAARCPDRRFQRRCCAAFQENSQRIARRHFPVHMGLEMLLGPLDLPAGLRRVPRPPLRKGVGLVLA